VFEQEFCEGGSSLASTICITQSALAESVLGEDVEVNSRCTQCLNHLPCEIEGEAELSVRGVPVWTRATGHSRAMCGCVPVDECHGAHRNALVQHGPVKWCVPRVIRNLPCPCV
jgi:hypothetical protein